MSMFSELLDGELSESSIAALRNKRDLGNITFEDPAARMAALRKVLLKASLGEEYVLKKHLPNLVNFMQQLKTAISSLKALDPATGGDKLQEYNNLNGQLQTQSDNILEIILPSVSMSSEYDSTYAVEQKAEVDKIISDMKLLRDVERSQTKLEASSNAASYFAGLGNKFEGMAKKNLIYLLATLVMLGSGVVIFEKWSPKKLSEATNVYELFPYFNLIAVGWFLVRIFSRNYRSNQHLSVINETKSKILEAGEKFAASARSDDMKDEITKIVVQNTFVNNDTGLISSDHDSGLSGQSIGQQISKILGGKS